MPNEERVKLYQRHISEAQSEQARWQAKIANAPLDMQDEQILIWRNRIRFWEQLEQTYRARLEQALKND